MKKELENDWQELIRGLNRNQNLLSEIVQKQEEQRKLLTSSPMYTLDIISELKKSVKPITVSSIMEPVTKAATLNLQKKSFAMPSYIKDMIKPSYSLKDYMYQPSKDFKFNSVLPFQKQNTFIDMSALLPQIPVYNFKPVNLMLREKLVEVPKLNLLNPVLEQLKNINFDRFSEQLNETQRKFDISLEKYDDLHWAVDEDLWVALRSGECTDETIAEHVEENINDYLEFFSHNDYYNSHSLIIEQAFNSLKQEQYASATFNLFAVIDGNITKAFKKYDIPLEERRNKKDKWGPRTFEKLNHYKKVKTNQDRIAFSFIFFKRMFNVYSVFFKTAWNGKAEVLNRNLVMHGTYDYNSITKEDVLKLIQLVKATSVLENITFE